MKPDPPETYRKDRRRARIEELCSDLADLLALNRGDQVRQMVEDLLIDFAEEIKRQTIEP
jgi:hypothetical protein